MQICGCGRILLSQFEEVLCSFKGRVRQDSDQLSAAGVKNGELLPNCSHIFLAKKRRNAYGNIGISVTCPISMLGMVVRHGPPGTIIAPGMRVQQS